MIFDFAAINKTWSWFSWPCYYISTFTFGNFEGGNRLIKTDASTFPKWAYHSGTSVKACVIHRLNVHELKILKLMSIYYDVLASKVIKNVLNLGELVSCILLLKRTFLLCPIYRICILYKYLYVHGHIKFCEGWPISLLIHVEYIIFLICAAVGLATMLIGQWFTASSNVFSLYRSLGSKRNFILKRYSLKHLYLYSKDPAA